MPQQHVNTRTWLQNTASGTCLFHIYRLFTGRPTQEFTMNGQAVVTNKLGASHAHSEMHNSRETTMTKPPHNICEERNGYSSSRQKVKSVAEAFRALNSTEMAERNVLDPGDCPGGNVQPLWQESA